MLNDFHGYTFTHLSAARGIILLADTSDDKDPVKHLIIGSFESQSVESPAMMVIDCHSVRVITKKVGMRI